MEAIKTFLQEYKKTIATAVIGVILYFGKSNLPELFNPEMTEAVEIVIGSLVVFFIGHFTRITNSEATYLNYVKK